MGTTRTVLVVTLAVALAGGCSKDKPNAGRRLPRLAPPPSPVVAADLRIEVQRDGKTLPPIDAARLRSTPPDLTDGIRRAWSLRHLLGGALEGVKEVEVAGDRGATVRFVLPPKGTGLEPALWLSRRGDVVAVLLDPAHPFSAYHGEGGQLGRPNDPNPRLRGVRRIRLLVAAARAHPRRSLRVRVEVQGGASSARAAIWTRAQLEAAGTLSVVARGGERREAWPLKPLLARHVGQSARLVAVVSRGGRRRPIDPAQWADPSRTPVLRPTSHGEIAFEWVDATGKVLAKGRARAVERLIVVASPPGASNR